MSIFGAIKLASDTEAAAVATLATWFETYLRELELQHTVPSDAYPLPKQYITAEHLDLASADALPAIVVVSPGLSGTRPRQEGDGSFRVFLSLGVGVFVAAKDRSATRYLVRTYTAIARSIMLQHQSLGGYADGTNWLDESYDDNFKFEDTETIGAGQVVFEIEVAGVVNRYGGPALYQQPEPAPDPATQPGSVWTNANTVTATVETMED